MRISFRQGVVNASTGFLVPNGSAVNLVVPPRGYVAFTAADQDTDYLVKEQASVSNAWAGPFQPGTNYWLFWDINVTTGALTRGATTIEPVAGATPPLSPVDGKHWFNTVTNVHSVYNSTRGRWVRVIRVFAARYNSSFFSLSANAPLFTGTQVGNTTSIVPGALIFDLTGHPVKRFDNSFFTTETPAVTGIGTSAQIKFGSIVFNAEAQETIPAYSVVKFSDFNKYITASSYDAAAGVYGIIDVDVTAGDITQIHVEGVIENSNWDWSASDVGTPLYVDVAGQLTTTPIGTDPIVATILDQTTVFFKPVAVGGTSSEGGGGNPSPSRFFVSDVASATGGYESNIIYGGYAEPAPTITPSSPFSQSFDVMSIGKRALEFVPLHIPAGGGNIDQGDGQRNIGLGYKAGQQLTTGHGNIFVGSSSHRLGTTSVNNVVIGHQAAEGMNADSNNVIIGYKAAIGLTSGSNNIIITTPQVSSTEYGSDISNSIIFGHLNNQFSQSDYFMVTAPVPQAYPLIAGSFTGYITEAYGTLQVVNPVISGGRIVLDSSRVELNESRNVDLLPSIGSSNGGNFSPIFDGYYVIDPTVFQTMEIELPDSVVQQYGLRLTDGLLDGESITVVLIGSATYSHQFRLYPARITVPTTPNFDGVVYDAGQGLWYVDLATSNTTIVTFKYVNYLQKFLLTSCYSMRS